ncbi:MAG: biotin/lipoyl-containing protein [Fimbriimonadaceae bacterium]
MKHLVNGREWEPGAGTDATVSRLGDRLVVRTRDGSFTALTVRSGGTTYVSYRGRNYKVERAGRSSRAEGTSDGELRAPMPGMIVEVSCKEGDKVEAGDRLLVLEAMKMQQPVLAPLSGRVRSVGVSQGDQVEEGQVLALVGAE